MTTEQKRKSNKNALVRVCIVGLIVMQFVEDCAAYAPVYTAIPLIPYKS